MGARLDVGDSFPEIRLDLYGGGTRTLPVLIYETAFRSYRMSEAATIAVLSTALLMSFAVIATRYLARAGDER